MSQAVSTGSRFQESLGGARGALRAVHPTVKLQALLVAGWLLVSAATLGAVLGSSAGGLRAGVRSELALGGRVLVVANESSSRWTDITYTLDGDYLFRQAVLEAGDHAVIPVARFRRGGVGGSHAPRDLAPRAVGISCEQGAARLTLAPEPAAGEGEPVSGEAAKRVLVVDDDHEVLEFLEVLLSVEGISTLRADGADAALRHLGAGGIGLVLLDIAMPGVDGLELCRRIKAAPETRQLPVVILSARPGQVAESAAIAAGADEFVHKPFDNDELVKLVRSKLGG